MDSTKKEKTNVDQPRKRRDATNCKVCDAPAIYCYLGVIVCASCKMFFKRNAQAEHKKWRCRSNGQCRVHIEERPMCFPCRLKKCFELGMTVELFRGSTAKKGTSKKTMPVRRVNLVETDQAKLSTEQWTHLSNIVHCYDEYSQYSLAQTLLDEQNRLPTKMRFRSVSVLDGMVRLAMGAQRLFEKNADFGALPFHDQSILVRNSIKVVTGLNNALFTCAGKFLEIPTCRTTIDQLYGPITSEACHVVGLRLDPDMVFFKLILSASMFSTFNCTEYTPDAPTISHDVRRALRIQDTYIELAWRYMIYKYDYPRAVRSFSNLVLSFLALHRVLTQVVQVQEYNRMIDGMVEGTGQLTIVDL